MRGIDNDWVVFRNDSSQAVPPWGVVMIAGSVVIGGESILRGTRPTSGEGTFAFNGPTSVAPGGFSSCSSLMSTYALFSGSSPSPGDEWGPVGGSWALGSSGDGFIVVGNPESPSIVRVRAADGGSTGPPGPMSMGQASVFSFRLSADMGIIDRVANATLVDDFGDPLMLPTPNHTQPNEAARLAMNEGAGGTQVSVGQLVRQVDTETLWEYLGGGPATQSSWEGRGPASVDITVVDMTAVVGGGDETGIFGLADYTDANGGSQLGYLGECRALGIPNYAGTGRPGYLIIDIEGPADGLLVKFTQDSGGGALQEITCEILQAFGGRGSSRLPAQFLVGGGGSGPGSPGFTVFDHDGLTGGSLADEIWSAKRNYRTGRYHVVAQSPGLKSYDGYDESSEQDLTNNMGLLQWQVRSDPIIGPPGPAGLPGAAGSPGVDSNQIVRFRLNQDFDLSSQEGFATRLNDDGSPTADNILLTDTAEEFTGYATYINAENNAEPAFQGTAIEYVDGGITKYYIVDIERLYPSVSVQLTEDITSSSGSFEAFFSGGLGNSYRIPKRSSSGKMTVLNAHNYAEGAQENSDWVAKFFPNINAYMLVSAGWIAFAKDLPDFDDTKSRQDVIHENGDIKWADAATSGSAVAIVSANVSGASGSLASFSPGIGSGKRTTGAYTATAEDITIHNISHTPIRASETDPIYLVGPVINGVLVHGLDLSGLPDFDRTKMQKAIHGANDEAFRLVGECDLDFVTKVTATATKLTFTRRPWDGCTETDVDIINIGPCT